MDLVTTGHAGDHRADAEDDQDDAGGDAALTSKTGHGVRLTVEWVTGGSITTPGTWLIRFGPQNHPRITRSDRRGKCGWLAPVATRRLARTMTAVATKHLEAAELRALDAYWRAANYLSVGQIYLLDNPLLREPLAARARQAAAARPLGHDARAEPDLRAPQPRDPRARPRRALRHRARATAGPGLVANTWLEGTYTERLPGHHAATRRGCGGCSGSSRSPAASRATWRPRRPARSTRAASSATR